MHNETPAAEVQALAAEYDPSQNFSLDLLKGDGSDRKIFLLQSQSKPEKPIVGVYHENLTENRDFILISAKMGEAGILVPEIFRVARSEKAYLLQYLGKYTLADSIDRWKQQGDSRKVIQAYEKTLSSLITIQEKLTPALSGFLKQRVMNKADFNADLLYWQRDFIHQV